MSTANSTPQIKVHALLVGINDYKNFPLTGCLKDVTRIKNYLQGKTDFECSLYELINHNATKRNIESKFNEIQEIATSEDTVFIYFSGHGCRVPADDIWEDRNEKLECIVCYNGEAERASDFLMADKELRYLIYKLYQKTKAHIVTVFDCCHAGDNTRVAFAETAYALKVNKRSVDVDFPIWLWNEFIFSKEIPMHYAIGKPADEFLPEGTHVQIAACQSDETSLEIGGEGVFTKHLVQVLEGAGGNLSYSRLVQRTRNYMRYIVRQQPGMYIHAESDEAIKQLENTGFLGKNIADNKFTTEAIYNIDRMWHLNIGAIHGIKKNTAVKLSNSQKPEQTFETKVEEVFIDFCKLQYNSLLDKQCVYKASVEVSTKEIKLKIKNHDGRPEEIKKLVELLNTRSVGHYTIVNDEMPDYDLNLRAGQTYLTKPNDPFRPLVKPVELDEEADFIEMSNILKHISRWHFVRDMENDSESNLPKESIKVEVIRVFPDGKEDVIARDNNMVEIKYQLKENVWTEDIKIKLTNITDQTLHVCAAYLPKDFQIYLNFLEGKVVSLESGSQIFFTRKSTNISRTEILSLTVDDVENEYNWKAYYERIKFIISTQPFDPTALQLEALPEPYTLKDRFKSRDDGKAKSLPTESKTPIFTGWIVQNLDLWFKNPDDKKIEAKKLQEMMEYDQMAYFAAGLYFDIKREHSLGPSELVLKEEFKLQDAEQEKRFFDSLKIRFANAIESRLRDRRYNKLRDKLPRIVALGDSWFQYPLLVRDILDHLSGLYAIKSLSAAGDTLRNYMINKEFVKAIEDERPLFFLISGGGNDILGEQFRGYLADEIDVTKQGPEKYLKNTLLDELDKLMELYRTMFKIITDKFPEVQILCHGYDYLIPIDTEAFPEKKSWLGKYMIEKKIPKQQDRVDIITFILDQFNRRMQAVANEFKGSVSYINLLGVTTGEDKWYDEIHPTNEGFQDISTKFINKMIDLKKKSREVVEEVDE